MSGRGDLVVRGLVTVDFEAGTVTVEGEKPLPFSDPKAFQLLADLWLRAG